MSVTAQQGFLTLSTLKRVGRNSGALTLTGGANKLATFIVLILANRALGRNEFGAYALVLATGEIVRVIAAFGVDQISLRAFARQPELQDAVLSNTLALKAITAAAAAVVFAGAAWYLRFTPEMWLGVALLSLDFFLGAIALSIVTFHQSKVRADRAIPGVVAGAVAAVLVGFVAFVTRAALPAFIAAVPAGNVVAVAILWTITRRSTRPSPRLASRSSILRLAQGAWPLAIAGVMVLLYFRISTLMLAKIVGLGAVASYTPAYKLSEAFLLVPAALSGTTLPWLATTLRHGPSVEGRRAYRSTMWIAIAVSVPFGLGCSFLGRFVLVHVFGPSYANSALALGLLGWATVLMTLNQQTGNVLLALNREQLIMWASVVNLATNVTANLILIPRLSFNGSAIATLITEAVNFLMLSLMTLYFLRPDPRRLAPMPDLRR